jgi:hypothetical protein
MDREIINEYMSIDEFITTPYTNHLGYGNRVGAGDRKGRGNGSSYIATQNNYTGKSIMSFNGNKVYVIDGYVLYFTNIHKPWASAKIIKNDLTTQDCYVGKINNHIAVGNSLHDVLNELRNKIMQSGNNDYDIALSFVYAHPEYEKEYDWEEMVFWHSLSEFSCQDGRKRFSENAHKSYGSTATPKELISFMKQSRAHNIAKKMEELYLSKK